MDKVVLVREELVPPTVLTDPIECPKCKGHTLTLRGEIRRDIQQEVVDGKSISKTISEEVEITLGAIECHNCNINFLITSMDQWELHLKIAELAEELSKHTGKGKPC